MRELLKAGKSITVIAKVLGKTQNAIRQKMIKLGLVEEKKPKNSAVFSSTLKLPKGLPSVETVLKKAAAGPEKGARTCALSVGSVESAEGVSVLEPRRVSIPWGSR